MAEDSAERTEDGPRDGIELAGRLGGRSNQRRPAGDASRRRSYPGQPRSPIWVRVILALATLLAVFAIFAVWANRQLMNPTNWAKTSTALLQSRRSHRASGYLVDQLYANVDVKGD